MRQKPFHGLQLTPNFITKDYEQSLIEILSRYEGKDRPAKGAPSRMIRFGDFSLTDNLVNDPNGAKHGYTKKRRSYSEMNDGFDVSIPTKDTPILISMMAMKISTMMKWEWDDVEDTPVVIFNKYPEGYRISRHIDHEDNGETLPVLSLLSDCVMVFTKRDDESQKISIDFPARSLLAINEDLRHEWYHEIKPCQSLRWSVVFRNLPK